MFIAAVASVISEMVVMIIYVYFGKKHFKLENVKNEMLKVISATCIVGLWLLLSTLINCTISIKLLIQIAVACVLYFMLLVVFKEKTVGVYVNKAVDKWKHNK